MSKVEITGVMFDGQHPIMDNPYNRTDSEVQELVTNIGSVATSTGVKLMMIQQALNSPNEGGNNE